MSERWSVEKMMRKTPQHSSTPVFHCPPADPRQQTGRLSPARPLGGGLLVLVALLVFCWARGFRPAEAGDPPADADADAEQLTDPLSANAACYVCHIPFVREELSKVHLKAEVPCMKCHGLSAGHANDEDIGATPPDKVFPREQIDAMCRECHESHDVSARKVIACLLKRQLSPESPPVCTECHGTHKIERPEDDTVTQSR